MTASRCPHCGALAAQARKDAHTAGFEAGYARGLFVAQEIRADLGLPANWASLEPQVMRLVHPDAHHGSAREELAGEVTRALIEMRERGRGRGR